MHSKISAQKHIVASSSPPARFPSEEWKIAKRPGKTYQPHNPAANATAIFQQGEILDTYRFYNYSPHSLRTQSPKSRSATPRSLRTMIQSTERLPPTRRWWPWLAYLPTFYIPQYVLSMLLGNKNKDVHQAWREKVTLCLLILLCCGGLGFATFGTQLLLCPNEHKVNAFFTPLYNETTGRFLRGWHDGILVYGKLYPYPQMAQFLQKRYNMTLSRDYETADLSRLFAADNLDACAMYETANAEQYCRAENPYSSLDYLQRADGQCLSLAELHEFMSLLKEKQLEFSWKTVREASSRGAKLLVLGDTVLDLSSYLKLQSEPFGLDVHRVLLQSVGTDGSMLIASWSSALSARSCLLAHYTTGIISSDTMGCIFYQVLTRFMLAMIVILIVARLLMSLTFHVYLSRQLASTAPVRQSPATTVVGHVKDERHISSAEPIHPVVHRPSRPSYRFDTGDTSGMRGPLPLSLYTIMLVTCYSEGEEALRKTLDSLASTHYSQDHKIFFIICDGMVTGSGNTKSTADICLELLSLHPNSVHPLPCPYRAIAEGERQLNAAKVYAGYYKNIPALLVLKCGTEEEQHTFSRPGNRGKRDSQLLLMNFYQRILFHEHMSQLDYEIFWKMTMIIKGAVTPDQFELILMVDADTQVLPDALSHMVAAMTNDTRIMGLCGETKVANKSESWVTAIQVFEYYMSHHYAKAFESVFGGVTCLPGCFSMYRIKAPKGEGWVPILASPDIIMDYNHSVVNSLHGKNLLLLGEDRFLSTLMLRTFPRRQMIFLPQAQCRTTVPSTFPVLLSQRRRWINSTVHNLMELVLVSDLCGIACLSMQFVVLLDLLASIVLPAAIAFSIYLIINIFISRQAQLQPLLLLLAIIGLPAILVVFMTRKMSYIGWMLIYLCSLPIWNFVLPIYAFWHFDDFSWGETRRVLEGETKRASHDPVQNSISVRVRFKSLGQWEKERWNILKM